MSTPSGTQTPGRNLDDRLNRHFAGRVVRKDLTKLVKEGANVPVYVFLNEGRRKRLVFFERIRSAQNLQNDVEDACTLELETAKSLASAILEKEPN